MNLKNPVTNFIPKRFPEGDVTQFFAESVPLYANVCDVLGCLTGGHNGWDIVRPHGDPLFCVQGGKVVERLINDNGYGKHIKILATDGNEWVYGHMSRIDVDLNQFVAGGQQIGLIGNTGFVVSGSTPYWANNPYAGTHLHLGVRKVVIALPGSSYNLQYQTGDRVTVLNFNNGTKGAVEFFPTDFEGYTPPPKPKYKFTKDLEYGMTDPDIKQLQEILKYEGLFSGETTQYYGDKTAKAVLAYQQKYGLVTTWQALTYRGRYCYTITRTHINMRYGG